MSTVSGTLTSSQGALVVETTAYDQLTITVSSGTFTLEYPMGTVLASGVTTTSSYQLGPGQFKLQVTAGSVAYSLERVSDGTTVQQVRVMTDDEFTILADGSGLTLGTVYRVGDPEVWYRGTGTATYAPVGGSGGDLIDVFVPGATDYTLVV